MITLRPYQNLASKNARVAFVKDRVVLIESPTGSGKTVIAGDIIQKYCHKFNDQDLKPVFLTDRIEIAEKTFETFTDEFGLKCQLITAQTTIIYKCDCYIAMAETFYRRCMSGRFPKSKVGMLFCDEAHMAVFNKTIELFTNIYICGLTATPVSASYNMNKVYHAIVRGEKKSTLIKQGFLMPSIDIGNNDYLKLRVAKDEYSAKDQREQFTQYSIDEKMIKLWERHAQGRQTIMYNIDIDHNDAMYKRLTALGLKCVAIDSKKVTSQSEDNDRKKAFQDYEEGRVQFLLNVGIATKGYDSPITECIVYNRCTLSLREFQQALGRGGRPCEKINKKNFITIDMGNNIDKHGSFNDDIDWEYLFHNPEQDLKKVHKPHTKLCPICFAFVKNVFAKECEVCGATIVQKNLLRLVDQMPEDLANKNVSDMDLKELQIYGKYKGFKPGWAWFQNGVNHGVNRQPWARK